MFSKNFYKVLMVVLGLVAASPSSAVTLLSETHNYGNAGYNPYGSDQLGNGLVRVNQGSRTRFFDGFNFSSLAYDTISSITLTINFANTGGNFWDFEMWNWGIFDSETVGSGSNIYSMMISGNSATFSASGSALTSLLATSQIGFNFNQTLSWLAGTANQNRFDLYSANLTIDGTTSPTGVPIPASGYLLLLALAGPLAMKSRRHLNRDMFA